MSEINLNIRQKKVVQARDSRILCLAAPAGGKTRVLTERIRYILEQGWCKPEDIVAITFTNQASAEMYARLGKLGEKAFIGTIHSYANRLCVFNGLDTQQYIREEKFDKIIERAMTIPRDKLKTISYLFVDECQDLGDLEFKFLTYLKRDNEYWTGDDRQCQPAGTKVWLRDGIIKNIEDITPGDSILYYDTQRAYASGMKLNASAKEKKVLKTAFREFVNDNLITITTESGLQSTYTPNHKTYVKVSGCEDKIHAVYLMCDNNYRFRVGKIPFAASKNAYHKNPWRDKMYKEGCTKIWILGLFNSDKAARVMETKISYTYGIPQTCWQQDKVMWTAEDLDFIYKDLNTYESAKRCLKDFRRDINYPLLDKEWDDSGEVHFARNAITTCYAANLMDEGMEVLVYDSSVPKKKKRYEKIVKVEYNYITEPIKVYSLEVEGGNYFADQILTHNCIYGFKGCSDKYLREMYEDPTYAKYYLVENYRNTPEIIDFAEGFLNGTEALSPKSIPKKTKNGFIERCRFPDALEELEASGNWGSWFIIARTNRDVYSIMEILKEKEIPNTTFKRSELSLDEMENLMAENTVKVMTCHAAKGLESPNVIVVGALTYNKEERRIAYVAATRAENNLWWCPALKKEEGKLKEPNRDFKVNRQIERAYGELIEF